MASFNIRKRPEVLFKPHILNTAEVLFSFYEVSNSTRYHTTMQCNVFRLHYLLSCHTLHNILRRCGPMQYAVPLLLTTCDRECLCLPPTKPISHSSPASDDRRTHLRSFNLQTENYFVISNVVSTTNSCDSDVNFIQTK